MQMYGYYTTASSEKQAFYKKIFSKSEFFFVFFCGDFPESAGYRGISDGILNIRRIYSCIYFNMQINTCA